MNKRSFALIFSVLIIAALIITGVAFFSRSFSERDLVQTNIHSTRAFWLAEAGIAQAINSFDPGQPFPQGIGPTTLGAPGVAYPTTVGQTFQATILDESPVGSGIHNIQSLGTVTLPPPGARTIQRRIQVDVLRPNFVIPGEVVTTDGPVSIGGSADILPITPDTDGDGLPDIVKGNVDFTGLFEIIFGGLTREQVKAQADYIYLDPDNNVLPVEGITWIDMPPGEELVISDNDWYGEGILIIHSIGDPGDPLGELKFTGGEFRGILWVDGAMKWPVAGNARLFGTMFVECGDTENTGFLGNCQITYSGADINNAFGQFGPTIISGTWQEWDQLFAWEP
jgi:hypothetical protein